MTDRGNRSRRDRRTWSDLVLSDRTRLAVAAVFLSAAFLMGGGSRSDIVSLVILRPLAVVAIGFALYGIDARTLMRQGTPFWLLLALLAWIALQLVPLPHGMWANLPGREIPATHDLLLFPGGVARPLSLVPTGTWNSLFSLTVPLAVMLGCARLDHAEQVQLLGVVFAAAALSALVAALQILGPPNGPLYFFRITNYNNPVGLFSNRNHFAIFLASVQPLVVGALIQGQFAARPRPLVITASVAAMVCMLVLVLASGSRAGTLLFAGSLAASCALWLTLAYRRGSLTRGIGGRFIPVASGGAIALATGLAILSTTRTTAIDRFLDESIDADLRVKVVPQLWEMLTTYFPFGSGFGSFARAYTTFEPFALLRPTYLNHAHNDFLEFPIEGGVVAAGLMLAFAVWLAAAALRTRRMLWGSRKRLAPIEVAPFAVLALAILIGGSVGDYPLRTPAIAAWAALLCCLIAAPRKDNGGRGQQAVSDAKRSNVLYRNP